MDFGHQTNGLIAKGVNGATEPTITFVPFSSMGLRLPAVLLVHEQDVVASPFFHQHGELRGRIFGS